MDIVVGVRDLCVAHIRTQVGEHSVQIFAFTHPVVQSVGSKSMTEVIKTWSALASLE